MKAIMGLEIHIHLLTKTKLFCSCSTEYEDKKPNENTCPICLGYPGSKPKVNKKAIDYGIMAAQALNCRILSTMFFSRKSYFYPDMPKNFQISQYEIPLAKEGYVELPNKRIRIRRIHLEEDPSKLVHVGGDITSAKYILADYNRSGIPLLEIVTEPDFSSTKEVREFLSKLSSILEYIGIYDPSREGSLRVDANISLEGGERIEIKNITGFKNVEKALNYEIVRQQSLTQMGIKVERETRHFDADTQQTASLRKKEVEEDYGYIFEPDLTMIEIDNKWKEQVKEKLPELPDQRVKRFQKEYGLSEYQSKVIVYSGKPFSDFFEDCCKLFKKPIMVAKWMITHLLKCLNYQGINIKQSKLSMENFVKFLKMIDERKITERLAKEMIKDITITGEYPEKYLKRKGLKLMSRKELEKIVKEVLEKNKKAVADYKSGEEKALEFLIGQVLRKIEMVGDPKEIRKLIKASVAQ